ncbi:hypothetical protein AKO1_015766 [Acrasis kona]|uniref:Uncharacterized protein n=1 Tax=Acrasis kona TaxID=1008807 RepID=A0AAW2ZIM0_9EUKA
MNIYFTAPLYASTQYCQELPRHKVMGIGNKRKRYEPEGDVEVMEDVPMTPQHIEEDYPQRKKARIPLNFSNQITLSLRGNSQQPRNNSFTNEDNNSLLNDFATQHEQYVRRNEYRREVDQFIKPNSNATKEEQSQDDYRNISQLLRELHYERNTRTNHQ